MRSFAYPFASSSTALEAAAQEYGGSGDAKLLPQFDLGACSPTVTPGSTYSLRAWYTASAVTQYAVYLRSESGAWQYWTSSPWFASSASYQQAVWTTPVIPAGYNGISFGLSMFNNGSITVDDYALYDTVGAPGAELAVAAIPGPAELAQRTVPIPDGPIEVFEPTESTMD